jgi:hypothetical protein
MLGNGFVYDDYLSVEANTAIQESINPVTFFANPELALANKPADAGGIYRPIGIWFFAIENTIFGLKSGYWHAVSLVIHLTNVLLIAIILSRIWGNLSKAFWVALLFGLHPIVSEPVAWITQQPTLLSFTFTLLSILAMLEYIKKHGVKYLLYFTILFSVSIFIKEQIVVFPAFVLLLCWYVKVDKDKAIRLFFASISVSALYIVTRVTFLGSLTQTSSPLGGSYQNAILTMIRGAAKYIYLSFVPYPLSVNYDAMGISTHFLELSVLISLAFLIVVFVVLFFMYIKAPCSPMRRDILFGASWFIIMLLTVNNIVTPLREIINERFLYIALPGILIVATSVVARFVHARYIFGSIAVLFMMITFGRTFDWTSNETLWRHEIELNENNLRNQKNYAAALDSAGSNMSLEHYKRAFEIAQSRENFKDEIIPYARGLSRNGRLDEALELLTPHIADRAIAYNYGLLLLEANNYEGAAEIFFSLAKDDSDESDTYFFALATSAIIQDANKFNKLRSLRDDDRVNDHFFPFVDGFVHYISGRNEDAIIAFVNALKNQSAPTPKIFLYLGDALIATNNTKEAIHMYELAYAYELTSIDATRRIKSLEN